MTRRAASIVSARRRIITLARGISGELNAARTSCAPGSFPRYGSDVLASRYMRFRQPKRYDARRQIRLRNGVHVVYRLSPADIQTVREVWFDQVYRLPFGLPGSGGTLVDLGGNIGQASVYLARQHEFDRVVIVEPVAENAELARLNCKLNGIKAEIVEAAIAPRTGEVNFSLTRQHNKGHIDTGASDGIRVTAKRVDDIVGPTEPIRLVKLDIEGGEEALLREESGWLDRVAALVAEFHPTLGVDCPGLITLLERRGFAFFPQGSAHRHSADAFLRQQREADLLPHGASSLEPTLG